MADNIVQLKIKASDTAKPDLTDLKAKLDELGAKVASATIDIDDKDGAAKLTDLNAKLASLNKRVANPKITVAGAARVEADLAMVDASLDKLGEKKDSVDIKARTDGFTAALASVTGLDTGLKGAQESGSRFQLMMAGLNVATGIAEPLLAGVTVAAGGVASGVLAAGAGLGVFAEVAKGAYSQVATALKSYSTAQSTTGKASATAMAQYKAELAALTPSQREFARGIEKADNEWQGFVNSNTAGVTKILDKGLGLLPKILSAMQPMLAPVETALSSIISKLGKGLDSSGFKSFTTMLADNTGPAVEKLATAAGHVAVGVGGILKAFMPMAQTMLSGIDKITGKFAAWGSTLTGHTGFQSMMSMFKSETPLAVQALQQLAGIVKTVVSDMTGLDGVSNSKTLLQLANPVLALANALLKVNPDLVRIALYMLMAADAGKKLKPVFSGISSGLSLLKGGASAFQDLQAGFQNSAAAASDATGVWGSLGGTMSKVTTAIKEQGLGATIAAAATKVWAGIQAAFNAVMDANPIVLVVLAIAALVAGVILAYTHFKSFRDAVQDAMHGVQVAVDTVVKFVSDHWKLLVAIILGPLGLIIDGLVTHWSAVEHGFEAAYNAVAGVVRTAIGVIKSIISPYIQWNEDIFRVAWAVIEKIFQVAWTAIKGYVTVNVDAIKTVLGWFGKLGSLFGGWWDDAAKAVSGMIDKLVGFVAKIPSRINSALSGLPAMLFKAGVNAIKSLISGIESMFGAVGNVVSSLASKVAGFFGLSPAKEGPLSGGGAPSIRGQHFAADIAEGMTSGLGLVRAAAARLSTTMQASVPGMTGPGLAGAGSAGYGSGVLKLQLEWAGGNDQQIISALGKAVRIRGGNVQKVFGHN